MIELRWLERDTPCQWKDGDVTATQTERVLQVRYDISHTQRVYFVNPEDRMSPWQDVPTVRE